MTSTARIRKSHARHERGLSLIELMIALTLSVLLVLGLVEIFSSTRSAFAASEGLARTQENSRFALDFLRRDLRMAGHMGCLNEFGHVGIGLVGNVPTTIETDLSFSNHLVAPGAALSTAPLAVRSELSVQVFDFTGTVPGSAYTIASTEPAVAPSGAGWTPTLPPELELVEDGIIPGSDVVVVRYFDEAPITMTAAPVGTDDGGVNHATGAVYLLGKAAQVTPFGVYGATNCRVGSLFQVSAVGTDTVNSLGASNLRGWSGGEVYGVGSMMFRYRAVVYFVGRGANGGTPSLFRKTLFEEPADAAEGISFAPAEEIVEGVELMQVLLATAAPSTAAGRLDDVTAYQAPTPLLTGVGTVPLETAALRRIGSVRVSLLMRSPDRGAGEDPSSATVVVGDVVVTPPLDQRIRQVYDSMILLRNRQRA